MPTGGDKSALLAALEWLDRGGQVTRNIARGNFGAARRHALDFVADPIDMAIPFVDAIPRIARPEDDVTTSELVGIDREKNPFLASVVDAGGGVVTNPLSALSFGKGQGVKLLGKTVAAAGKTVDPLTVAGQLASAGINKLPPSLRKPIRGGIQSFKETVNWLNPDENLAELINRGDAASDAIGRAKKAAYGAMYEGVDLETRIDATKLVQNFDRDPATGKAFKLGPSSGMAFGTMDDQEALLQARASATRWDPARREKALEMARKALHFERTNYAEAVEDFPIFDARKKPTVDADGNKVLESYDTSTHAPLDYAHRAFELEDQPNMASALKGRKHRNDDEFVKFLNEPGVTFEEDLAGSTAARAAQQGRMAKRALVGKELLSRGATGDFGPEVQKAVNDVMAARQASGAPLANNAFSTLSDARSRGVVDDVLTALEKTSPDNARILKTAWKGLEQSKGIWKGLEAANRIFKPAAVTGIGWPGKVSSVVRNAIAFPSQFAANPEAGWGQAGRQLLKTPEAVWYAMRQGMHKAFGWELPAGEMVKLHDTVDAAFKQAGGRLSVARKILMDADPDLAAAIDHGVIDAGFVSADMLHNSIRESTWGKKILRMFGAGEKAQKKIFDFLEAPQEQFKAAEEFARLGNFLDLVKRRKMPHAQAAKVISDSLYNYNTVSESNRKLATILPFAKFQTNAVRQGAKFLSNTPAVGAGMAGLYGEHGDDPIYPYLQEQLHIGVGDDEEGNPQYLAGLGLPIEALNSVPNILGTSSLRSAGREVERTFGGSMQPTAKTAYGALTGHDPFFGTPFQSYDKIPVYGSAGSVGRLYNLIMGTGLLQPIETPLNIAGKIADERKSIAERAVDLLTGAKFVSVDPDRAIQQQLTRTLESNPEVMQSRSLYAQDPSDETAELLKELNRVKSRLREKRKAAATE